MERLTKNECSDSELKSFFEKCNLLLSFRKKVYKKLQEYEQAVEEGLLVKLPCKVGDKVYEVYKNQILTSTVVGFVVENDGLDMNHRYEDQGYGCVLNRKSIDTLGDNTFLTEAEALQELEKREKDERRN